MFRKAFHLNPHPDFKAVEIQLRLIELRFMLTMNTENLTNNAFMHCSITSLFIHLTTSAEDIRRKSALGVLKLVDRLHQSPSSDMLHPGKLRLREGRAGFTLPD